MRDRPTGQEMSFYAENGLVVLPGILSGAECAAAGIGRNGSAL
ncbi:MAG: hypothetical protein ACRDN0_01580 [Trebonia sp.]